jgi:hypothetical protein
MWRSLFWNSLANDRKHLVAMMAKDRLHRPHALNNTAFEEQREIKS